MRCPTPSAKPLDVAALERLALRYVERFATTQGRLADYLCRKLRERGWEGERPDAAAVAARMAALGYVDDRAFAQSKAAAMARRGLGARRIEGALRQARVAVDDIAALDPVIADRAVAAALAFARRRRIGPFAAAAADRPQREKQLAAMIRAGHAIGLARRIVATDPGDATNVDESDVNNDGLDCGSAE